MVNNNYQTKINLIYNAITFVINALIGLVLPSFLIKELGISTYSLIPISMSITSFMVVFTIAINGTLSRFLSVDLENNEKNVNKTFVTSFYLLIGIFMFFLPLIVYFLIFPQRFLDINPKDIHDAQLLFIYTITAFITNSFGSLFNSIPYVKNRIDLRNIALIISKLGVVVVIIILFFAKYINIQAYGIAVFVATILSFIYSFKTAKKLYPTLTLKFKYFDKNQLNRISKLGFWLIISQIGVVLFLQTDIVIVNKLLGAKLSGVFGTLVQWSFLVRTMVGMVGGVIGPIILRLYAKNQIKQLIKLTTFSIKVLGIFASIIVMSIVHFSNEILKIWIGSEFQIYSIFLVLIVFHLGYNTAYSSIINLNIAYNKAKIPAIITVFTGLLNIILGYMLIFYYNFNLYGIVWAGFISLTLKNLIFTPLYVSYIMKIPKSTFYKPIIPSLVITIFGMFLYKIFPPHYLLINNYFSLAVYMGLFVFVLSSISWFFFITNEERKKIINIVSSKLN